MFAPGQTASAAEGYRFGQSGHIESAQRQAVGCRRENTQAPAPLTETLGDSAAATTAIAAHRFGYSGRD